MKLSFPCIIYKMSNATKSRVKVTSKLTTVSSRPIGPCRARKFSEADRGMSGYSLHVVYYYKASICERFDLDPLKLSLSEALSLYPPVTGRVVPNGDGSWVVACNDAGVRTFRAKVGATLDEWLRSADGAEEEDLTAWEPMPDDPTDWSPFRIQVSELECGGMAVGISCPHMHADLTCLALLHKSWTDIYRRGAPTHPPVFLDPKPDPHPHPHHRKPPNPSPPNTATATFKFSHASVEKGLLEVAGACSAATPFDFLAALFCSRVAVVKNSVSVSVCTDARASQSLPLGFFGNALRFSRVSLEDDDDDERVRLARLTRKIHDATVDESTVTQNHNDSGFGEGYAAEAITCVSMEHAVEAATELGFGEEAEPVHVSYRVGGVAGQVMILVAPSPEKGFLSRTVVVTLPLEDLAQLCHDKAVRSFYPVLLLAGNLMDTAQAL